MRPFHVQQFSVSTFLLSLSSSSSPGRGGALCRTINLLYTSFIRADFSRCDFCLSVCAFPTARREDVRYRLRPRKKRGKKGTRRWAGVREGAVGRARLGRWPDAYRSFLSVVPDGVRGRVYVTHDNRTFKTVYYDSNVCVGRY